MAAIAIPQALAQPVAAASAPPVNVIPAPTGYAELFIDLWLRGDAQSASGSDSLRAMAPGVDLPAPADGSRLSVQRVVAVRSSPMGGHTWLVTVAATLAGTAQRPAPADTQSPAGVTQSAGPLVVRYFAVPVSMTRGPASGGSPDALAVTSAPAQVAGPAALSGADTEPYGTQVGSGPLQQAVAEYLAAYLTGVGESARYVTPGVRIPAAGAVYSKVELQGLAARTPVPPSPADGAVLEVQAQVRATDSTGQWPLTYPLRLKARAGRWEVAAVAPAGASSSPSSSSSSSSPSPSAPASATGVR
ncbi:conjugal transfer protein [Kitasatospora sp. NPDC088548]|uniref:conjugal transfer protein n=1 Tax=Kitasatospora sp. NPDC088548 TaxID=3364075 RepID=UPI00382CD2A3